MAKKSPYIIGAVALSIITAYFLASGNTASKWVDCGDYATTLNTTCVDLLKQSSLSQPSIITCDANNCNAPSVYVCTKNGNVGKFEGGVSKSAKTAYPHTYDRKGSVSCK